MREWIEWTGVACLIVSAILTIIFLVLTVGVRDVESEENPFDITYSFTGPPPSKFSADWKSGSSVAHVEGFLPHADEETYSGMSPSDIRHFRGTVTATVRINKHVELRWKRSLDFWLYKSKEPR